MELLPSSSSLLTQQEDHQTATNTAQQQHHHHHHHPDSSLHHLHLHYPTNILQLLDLNAGEDEGTFGSNMTKSSNGDKNTSRDGLAHKMVANTSIYFHLRHVVEPNIVMCRSSSRKDILTPQLNFCLYMAIEMMTINIYKDGMVVCCPVRARNYSRGVESQGYQLCTLQLSPEFGKWRPIRRVLCCQNVPKISVPTVK